MLEHLRRRVLSSLLPAWNAPEASGVRAHSAAALSPTGSMRRAPRGPVLMLDIDGVLHPGQAGSLIYLPMLEDWLRQHPQVDVVVSSNWRETRSLDELQSLFSFDIRVRIIGTTPVIPGARREDEIAALADEYGIEQWAAVDDRGSGFPHTGQHRLAKTESLDGLTKQTFERLEEILSLPAKSR